jgi:hypothetical protein
VADVARWMRFGRRMVRLELLLYAAVVRWIVRRRAVPAGSEPWGYGRLVAPMLWLWVFGSAVETVAFHLLIPWEGLRLVVDIISIWGLVWMLGMLAGYHVYPHLVTDDELRVRSGVYHDIRVPRSAIATAVAKERDLASSVWLLQVEPGEQGYDVSVAVSGRTNVLLTLAEPTVLSTAKGDLEVRTMALWADEPSKLAAALDPVRRRDRSSL